jgi:ubiquinone/menaquinone biosynthesis C-methylase UbiE/uncharacterized protein YbaR (Trm112 family)
MDNFLAHLICPDCGHKLKKTNNGQYLLCEVCSEKHPIHKNRPILLNGNSLFSKQDLFHSLAKRKRKKRRISTFAPKTSVNLSSHILPKLFKQLSISTEDTAQVLVIGAGSSKNWLDKKSSPYNNIKIIYSDIDSASEVDLYCDAHSLPFIDSSFDGIIIVAVLEHVLYPEIVVKEIKRVIKNNGLLYSEIPFMQHVHEGAYDFTRYTLSGHRRLFNSFTEIKSGMVAGPGTVLVWSIENFFISFFMKKQLRNIVKAMSRYLFFWIKYFDFIFRNKPQAMDGASCTYFYGKKNNESKISDKEIINIYIGAKLINHIDKGE